MTVISPNRHQTRSPVAKPDTGFRPDIEGLRGIAVLLVVLYHVGIPGLTGGFVGVDVFFVLSGYLITGLLVRELESTGQIDLMRFYARRARRLLPAATLMLLVTALVGLAVFSPVEQQTFSRTTRATALYVSNLWFAGEAGSYFAAESENNPLLHTWSLAVEEQFYLGWPIVILIALSAGLRRKRLIWTMVGIAIVSLVGSIWLTKVNQPWAFYASPARAWEFAIGGLGSLFPLRVLAARRRFRDALSWAGLVAVGAAAMLFTPRTAFPGYAALLPAVGTVAMLVANADPVIGSIGQGLRWRWLQRIGQLSYSWYLWHWPALVIAAVLVPDISVAGRLAVAVGSLVIAAVAYSFVENPIRFNRFLSLNPVVSLSLAFVIPGVLALGSFGWQQFATRAAESPEQLRYTRAANDIVSLYGQGCLAEPATRGVKECTFGNSSSATTVVLFGDSHAAQWFPAAERIAARRNWKLVTILRNSCPAVDATVFHGGLGRAYVECDRWRAAAIDRIAALDASLVIMGSSTIYVNGPGRNERRSVLTYEEWENGTRETLTKLRGGARFTVLIRDNPRAHVDVPSCLSRAAMPTSFGIDASSCTLDREMALDPEIFAAEQRAAAGLSRTAVVDLADQFCTSEECEPIRNDLVVYRDNNHLTTRYVASLTEVLEARMKTFLDALGS